MDLKKEDFEELQMCKYMYIGDHNSRYLCHRCEGWVDCTYNHCPYVMKPCEGEMRINGQVFAKVKRLRE